MMAMNWRCSILSRHSIRRTAGKTSWLLLFSCLLLNAGYAQTGVPAAASVSPPSKTAPVVSKPLPTTPDSLGWTLVRTIPLAAPAHASLDRRGTLYVADGQNNIHQYSADGQPLNTYSPALPGHIAQLEAWNLTKILAFYDDQQQILLLDRFLAPITQVRLTDYIDGQIRTATLAPDNKIWLLNESDLTLRQFDPTPQRLVAATPLDVLLGRTKPDFRFMRHYQNNLYLIDYSSGIYVFDNLGTYRKKLPFPGLSYVGFRGDELYYVANGALHFFQLYTLAERIIPLPAAVARSTTQVLFGEQYIYLLLPNSVQVYRL
ncbi:hypothetical protein [Hymenobacter sp. DG25A]|uniref:hypothetical protein n=1 Tax=Hymenobacter sp. DG25A TaxID=1385663 RepID=UPI0018D18FEC|nr:hypothetical protein [Hymenobacter sp. DG25A]